MGRAGTRHSHGDGGGAGHLLKMTISQPSERARAAQKMAMLRTTHALS